MVSFVVLGLSFLFEGGSWLVALRHFSADGRRFGYYQAFVRSKDPPAFMVLLEDSAALLGIDAGRARRWLLLASSLLVGAAVSAAGLVGFVGLVVPHALRLVLGPDHRLLVPASALAGAAFLVVCDTLARSMLGGRELPVGALTALAGGPFFLLLVRRSQARGLRA